MLSRDRQSISATCCRRPAGKLAVDPHHRVENAREELSLGARQDVSVNWFYSPGFGGFTALLAGAIVGWTTHHATLVRSAEAEKQLWEERNHRIDATDAAAAQLEEERERRRDAARDTAIRQCWDRFVWLVSFAYERGLSDEPELTLELCQRVYETAQRLDDKELGLMQFELLTQWTRHLVGRPND